MYGIKKKIDEYCHLTVWLSFSHVILEIADVAYRQEYCERFRAASWNWNARQQLHVEPETSGMSGTVIDSNLNADDDSDHDPHYHPDDGDRSSTKTEVAGDDASIRTNLDHQAKTGIGENVFLWTNPDICPFTFDINDNVSHVEAFVH